MRGIAIRAILWLVWSGLAAAPGGLVAQGGVDLSKVGYFNFVVAIRSKGKTRIEVEGRTVGRDGLRSGEESGPLGLLAGRYDIVVENDDCRPLRRKLTVEAGQSVVYVLYDVEKEEGGKTVRLTRAARIDRAPAAGDHPLSVYSVVQEPEVLPLSLGGRRALRARWKEMLDVPGWDGKGFRLMHQQRSLGSVENAEETGLHYLLVPYRDHRGRLRMITTAMGDWAAARKKDGKE